MNTKPTTQEIVNALKDKKFNEAKAIIEQKYNGKVVPMGCDAIARYEIDGENFYTVNFFNYDRMGQKMPPPTFNFY